MLNKVEDELVVELIEAVRPDSTITVQLNGANVELSFIQNADGAFVLLSDAAFNSVAVRLWKKKKQENKADTRSETDRLIAEYRARGGEIHNGKEHEGTGYTARDWARKQQGLKVATPQEIEVERDRRAIVALKNKDAELVSKILLGKFDKQIKFDIENDRIGPDGKIRNPAAGPVRNAARRT